MDRGMSVVIASAGVFAGSLFADVLLGDGVQVANIQQAAMVGLIAAAIQWLLQRNRK